MLILSLLLFAACLIVIGVSFARSLSHMDEVLRVVEPGTPEAASAGRLARAGG